MTVNNTGDFVIITADIGNVFKSKINGDILTEKLYLGCNDSVDNYIEINEEEAYEQTES